MPPQQTTPYFSWRMIGKRILFLRLLAIHGGEAIC
jgi:hypothetical protein